jgi:hypothetical protein
VASDLAKAARPKYGIHFGVVYFVLAAVIGASIGTFIVLVGRQSKPEVEWSAWAPSGSPDERVEGITSHVSRKYRLPSGNQLVGVLAQPPSLIRDGQQFPIRGYGFATPSPTTGRPNVAYKPAEASVEYILCGVTTTDCSIPERPTPASMRLLRREALELALYTFRYVDGVKSVFALLPPAKPGDEASAGLYFTKSSLEEELKHPLRRTLPQQQPLTPEGLSAIEQTVVDRLTTPNFYRFQYQQVPDGSYVLVLAPPNAT